MLFSEFLEWVQYLNQEEERNTKADWYLAQIAAEIRRSWVSDVKNVRAIDFLLAHTDALPEPETELLDSKMVWAACLGVNLN
jgi:hypothetical protein